MRLASRFTTIFSTPEVGTEITATFHDVFDVSYKFGSPGVSSRCQKQGHGKPK
jgi:hypothetical protein